MIIDHRVLSVIKGGEGVPPAPHGILPLGHMYLSNAELSYAQLVVWLTFLHHSDCIIYIYIYLFSYLFSYYFYNVYINLLVIFLNYYLKFLCELV